jgi:hypothetical protein
MTLLGAPPRASSCPNDRALWLRPRSGRPARARVLLFVATLVSVAGCNSGPHVTTEVAGPGPHSAAPPAAAPDEQLSPDVLAAVDPCATRLEDISAALLEYYRLHDEFPETLEGAQLTSPGGLKLAFTCPISRKPYGYRPQGLQSLGRQKRIIVYDPAPSHDGKRWCVFFSPAKPKQPAYLEVYLLADKEFLTYMPVAEHLEHVPRERPGKPNP